MKTQCGRVSLSCFTFFVRSTCLFVWMDAFLPPASLFTRIYHAVGRFLSPTVLPAIKIPPLPLVDIHTNSVQGGLVFCVDSCPASFHFTLPGQWDSGESRQDCKKPQLTPLADLWEESWNMRGGRNGSRHLIVCLWIGRAIEAQGGQRTKTIIESISG